MFRLVDDHGAIFFDGQVWKRMDPTFVSSAEDRQEILDFVETVHIPEKKPRLAVNWKIGIRGSAFSPP